MFVRKICILGYAAAVILSAQVNNRMEVDSLWESEKVNLRADQSYLLVHSQAQDLRFDSNNEILNVVQQTSGDWEVWLSPGTHILYIDAPNYQRLTLPPRNFQRKRSYEMQIRAITTAQAARADENLFDVVFRTDQDSIYSGYADRIPTMTKGLYITYRLPRGKHTFRFMKSGFADETREVEVSENLQLQLSMTKGQSSHRAKISLPAWVDITSEPASAEILINGQKMGNTPMQVELEAGNFQLEIRKSMYATDISEFSLKESQTIPITRTLKPRFGYLSVNASIPNSKITLDGKMLPSSSIEKAQISSGAHTVKIEQALYHVFNETFSVADGEHKVIKAQLRPAFGSLAVRSEPESGADVYLDGVNVGKTPYSTATLASGRYQLKVTKPLYGDAEEQIEITDEGKTERTIVLSKNFGELEITAPDAAIYVKEQLAGSGQVLLKLPPGRYKVKALRTEKYYPAEEDVILGIGDMKKITLTPEPKMGIVTVTTAPYEARDAEIFVDEKPNGNAPRSLELIIGTYTLTARKTGYLDVSQSIAIIENQKQRLDLQMMTYAGSQAEKANLWARYKWISWGVAALAGGATLYFHSAAESNYSNYSSAKTSADAQTYWDKTTLNNSLKNVSIGVAGATLVTGLISLIVQSGYGN